MKKTIRVILDCDDIKYAVVDYLEKVDGLDYIHVNKEDVVITIDKDKNVTVEYEGEVYTYD